MKNIKLIFASVLLITSVCLVVGFNSSQKKIYDNAGLFSANDINKLQQLCVDTSLNNHIDIAIVTITDNEGKTDENYAKDFYSKNGFGYDKQNGDGVILLINMKSRTFYIKNSGICNNYLVEDRLNSIISDMNTYLKKGDYYNACQTFVNKVDTYMKTLPATQQVAEKTLSQKLLAYMPAKIAISLGVGVVIVLIMMYNAKAKMTVGSQTYVKDHNFDVQDARDIYINTTVVKHKIPTNNNGGGSGGGSGGSFGGKGGSF